MRAGVYDSTGGNGSMWESAPCENANVDFDRLRTTASELLRRLRESGLSINAAAIAYNAFLALVPLAFAMLGVAASIGQSASAVQRVERALDPLVPTAVKEFIVDLLVDAGARVGDGSLWLVLGSVVLALFFGSRAVITIQKSLAFVEETTERRPALQMRLVAIALTVAGGVALVITSTMLVAGRQVIEFVAEWTGVGFLDEIWVWLRVPIAAGGLFAFLLALYRLGPPDPMVRSWLAASVGTTGAVLGSLAFGVYLSTTPELGATFGVLGAVAVALVWLYVGALAIVFGAIVAAHTGSDSGPDGGSVR